MSERKERDKQVKNDLGMDREADQNREARRVTGGLRQVGQNEQ